MLATIPNLPNEQVFDGKMAHESHIYGEQITAGIRRDTSGCTPQCAAKCGVFTAETKGRHRVTLR